MCVHRAACALAYTIAYSPCAPRPTDPVSLGQLWPTGPIYSLYTAYMQPICSLYAARREKERGAHIRTHAQTACAPRVFAACVRAIVCAPRVH